MKTVQIKGFRFNTTKNLQDFVIFTIKTLFELDAIPEEELKKLQNKDYCKKTFNLDFPLLSKNPEKWKRDDKHSRYYAKQRFYIDGFYLCNHWFKQDKLFANWLKELSDTN